MAYDELLREPNAVQEDIKLCDAVGVARHANAFIENTAARGATMMAIGSKPHAIGLAFAALSEQIVEAVCRTPASSRDVDVTHSAEPLLYHIDASLESASTKT